MLRRLDHLLLQLLALVLHHNRMLEQLFQRCRCCAPGVSQGTRSEYRTDLRVATMDHAQISAISNAGVGRLRKT